MELKEVIREVKEKLKSVGITDISETEWLIAEALKIKRSGVYLTKNISTEEKNTIDKYVELRMMHMPLDYITGESEFFGLKLFVNSNVLIPRPETELLVEEVLKVTTEGWNILDMCTGSGAIAIAIKKNCDANVTAVDISKEALKVAEKNAKNHLVEINFIQSDLFENVDGEFDIIVSNPPYIPTKDIEMLEKDVKDYEPNLALDGGVTGLDIYKRIVENLDKYLKTGGYLFLEIGINQSKDISQMFGKNYTVEIIKDYNNIDRILKVRRIS